MPDVLSAATNITMAALRLIGADALVERIGPRAIQIPEPIPEVIEEPPPPLTRADDPRRQKLLGDIDPSQCFGLEIGPMTYPFVLKSEGNVLYVDYASTEEIRGREYGPSIDPSQIFDIDIVWGDVPLCEKIPQPADYIVASHVIEHVPDVVGWLHELRDCLRPGGTICLIIPDRRFTFDIRRNESTLGEMIEAMLLRYKRPSIRQMFDHCLQGVVVDKAEAWQRDVSRDELKPIVDNPIHLAYKQACEIAKNPRYIDSHCWVFTPQSFLERVGELIELKLFPFAITKFIPTEVGEFEFFVHLQKSEDPSEIQNSLELARQIPIPTPPAPEGDQKPMHI